MTSKNTIPTVSDVEQETKIYKKFLNNRILIQQITDKEISETVSKMCLSKKEISLNFQLY